MGGSPVCVGRGETIPYRKGLTNYEMFEKVSELERNFGKNYETCNGHEI